MITLVEQDRRVYLTGDTFAYKDAIKELGGKPGELNNKFAWWVGAAKLEEAKKLVERLNNAPPKKQDPKDIRLTGKGKYKGREYYAGSITKDGTKVRLLTLPNDKGEYLDFWALCSEVEQTKAYSPREYQGRMEYTTLGGIASFIAKEKRNKEAGDMVCAECGKSGELVRDLEDGAMKHRRCCDIEP